MNVNFEVIIGAEAVVIILLLFIVYKYVSKSKKLEKKFSKVIDIDTEVENSKQEKKNIETEIEIVRSNYNEKKKIFDRLVEAAAIYDEEIELAELGFYKPHFDFDSSEQYKEELAKIKENQKQMVSDKSAVTCTTEWSVEGSKAKGRAMTNRAIRLTARAFNNECEAAIANVRWNNAARMKQRIQKAFDAINKLNESTNVKISDKYLGLKVNELRLAHEYKEKKQKEKEEQAEIRRQMREEAKLEQEMEKAIQEETKYKKLLDKAKAEAEKAAGDSLDKLSEKIETLTKELEEAHAKSERAKSMAQQTKSGHVYIISNIGSFGDDVYKIGMTRRLDPLDRVKELGDASVPFIFDVHAMIYSNDAPALESALHNCFEGKRINLVNNRKEFFNINLEAIEGEVKKISPESLFIETTEAREYKESKAIREQQQMSREPDMVEGFPASI